MRDAVDVVARKVKEGDVADLRGCDLGILPPPGFHKGIGACLGRDAVRDAEFDLIGAPHHEGATPREEVSAGELAVFRLVLCRAFDVTDLTTSYGCEEFSLCRHIISRR